MPLMTKIVIGLIVEFLLIALGYAMIKDWWRVLYFVSAALINVSALMMR